MLKKCLCFYRLSSYKHWLAAHRARLRIKSAGYVTAPDKSGFGRKSPIYRALFCSPAIYRGAFCAGKDGVFIR
jgi:hypothetical protein